MTEAIDTEIFECSVYHLPIPKDKQPGFCARKHRTAAKDDYCRICPEGEKAAKETRGSADSTFNIQNSTLNPRNSGREEVNTMAEKKKCSCGCEKNAVKEGLAWGCYVKKHGKPPYGPGAAKAGRQAGRKSVRRGTRGKSAAEPG